MLFRAKKQIKRKLFDRHARKILATPKVGADPNSDLLVITQLQRSDLYMYLVAIKTLLTELGQAQILILDDGLGHIGRDILKQHIKRIRFLPVSKVEVGHCPSGATWERLLTVCDECQTKYVIQADSDVLAVGPMNVVKEHVKHNRSFVLASSLTPNFVSAAQVAAVVADQVRDGDTHVQPVAESHFPTLPHNRAMRYIRGCSGFAGFAVKGVSRGGVEDFSVAMERIIGPKWREWGSEQVASNYAIANSTNAAALPIREYLNFRPGVDLTDARLVHFMGTHRYDGGVYRDLALREIKAMSS